MALSLLLPRLLVVAALLWPAAQLGAQAPDREATPDIDSVAGQLLVASPDIGDSRFDSTVILVVRHDRDGAFGIVINKPVDEQPIADILKWIGEPNDGVEGKIHVVAGGPVQPGGEIVVHSADYRIAETITLDAHVAVTSAPEILRDLGRNRGPKKAFIAFGYTGWMPGQLERELDHRDWAAIPNDPSLVFDIDREKVWEVAWSRRAISL